MKSYLIILSIFLIPALSFADNISPNFHPRAELALQHTNAAINSLSGESQNFYDAMNHTKEAKRFVVQLIYSQPHKIYRDILRNANSFLKLSVHFIEIYDAQSAIQNLTYAAEDLELFIEVTADKGHCCKRYNCKRCIRGYTTEASCRELDPDMRSFRYLNKTCINF